MSVTFQTMEGFDGLNADNFNASVFCLPADGGPGCGKGLAAVHGPVPPFDTVGDARWSHSLYTLVTGWNGIGLALSAARQCTFTFEKANSHDTLLIGARYKTGSLAATQTVLTLGGSYVLEVLITTGVWKLRSLLSGANVTFNAPAATASTWYHIECAVYLATAGSGGHVQLQVNGVEMTSADAVSNIDTKGSGPGLMAAFVLGPGGAVTGTGTYDDVYAYAGTGGFDTTDFLGNAARLPVLSTLRPTAQGSYAEWDQYVLNAGTFAYTFVAPAASTNWTYLDEVQCDGPVTHLGQNTNNKRDSWIMSALDASAGDVLEVMTSFHVGAGGSSTRDSHAFIISGTAHAAPDDGQYEYITSGAQSGWTARYWPNNPGVRGWAVADFQTPCEVSCVKVGGGANTIISQALVLVMWLEALPVVVPPPEDVGAECAPCDTASAAQYFDSFLPYTGVNTTAGTVTLVLSPGADWTTPGLTHTLTSAALFLSTDFSPAPAKAFRLGDPDGDNVIVDVTAFGSTSSLTVTNRTPVPVSLQAVATTTWARMVKAVAGLGHLEAEVVYALLDGIPYGPFTVASGAVTFAVHAAVAVVGLKIQADFETLDFDIPGQGRPVWITQKLTGDVTVHLKTSRQFQAGDPNNPTGMKPYTLLTLAQRSATPHMLKTGPLVVKTEKKWEKSGRVYLRSDDGLPFHILSVEPDVAMGGK